MFHKFILSNNTWTVWTKKLLILIIIILCIFDTSLPFFYLIKFKAIIQQSEIDNKVFHNEFVLKPRIFLIDPNSLLITKIRINVKNKKVMNSYKALLSSAENLLNITPYTVTSKTYLPPSNDKHDYFSIRPYVWKDDKGKYINIDQKVNPVSLEVKDFNEIEKMSYDTFILALAYYLSDDIRFAKKAVQLIETWFLDEKTKMNPNFTYAQSLADGTDAEGGSVDGANLPLVIDAIGLLSNSKFWSTSKQTDMKNWFTKLLINFLETPHQIKEASLMNNHGTWNDVQIVSMALFLDKIDLAREIIQKSKTKRIQVQIQNDGSQPLELNRINSYFYSIYNLTALTQLAALGRRTGIDLWKYTAPNGGSIKKSIDFLLAYSADYKKWPYSQKDKSDDFISYINNRYADILLQAYIIYNENIYEETLNKLNFVFINSNRILLYPY